MKEDLEYDMTTDLVCKALAAKVAKYGWTLHHEFLEYGEDAQYIVNIENDEPLGFKAEELASEIADRICDAFNDLDGGDDWYVHSEPNYWSSKDGLTEVDEASEANIIQFCIFNY